MLPLTSIDEVRIEVTKPEDMAAVATVTLTKALEVSGSAFDCVTVTLSESVVVKERAK